MKALETCTNSYYLVFNFYQINKDNEIQIYNCLIIKILISYQEPSQLSNLNSNFYDCFSKYFLLENILK